MIGALQTVNYFQNNMIPCGNDMYSVVYNGDRTFIHTYKNVIGVAPQSGSTITFTSPFMNFTYRKMIYFLVNKKFLRAKKGLILPYLNDNFIMFNKRENLTQYCHFFDYRNPQTLKQELDMICLVPFTKQLLQYNQKGQLLNIFGLKKPFQDYGDKIFAQSNNGQYFLMSKDDENEMHTFAIMKIDLKLKEVKDDLISSPKKDNVNELNA